MLTMLIFTFNLMFAMFTYPHVGYLLFKNSIIVSFWIGWLVPRSTHFCHLCLFDLGCIV